MSTGKVPPLAKEPPSPRGTLHGEPPTDRGITIRKRSVVVIGGGRGEAKQEGAASQRSSRQPSNASSLPLGTQAHLRTARTDTPVTARRSSDLEDPPPPWDRQPNMGGFPTPEYAAEEHLWYVFAALSSRNAKLASEMDASFLKEVAKPIIEKSMIERFTAGIYRDCLKLRVKEMPITTLAAYHRFALNFPDKENQLVESVGLALKTEIQRRDDAKTEELLRLTAADPHMKEVLEALGTKNEFRAAFGVEEFLKAMKPLNDSTANSDGAAFDMYKDRLKMRLLGMEPNVVKALMKGAEEYLRGLDDPVVKGIHAAAEEQLEQRRRTTLSFGSPPDGPSS